ncbi:carbohydrate ABC transporter permease [Actinopolymorpha sp. B17G11]|uniref:carbohydrate ABC transporter permease n=1 Tax=unclassified Actinopolymorpha TaxID=2627063 RepID=UPI0032D954EA
MTPARRRTILHLAVLVLVACVFVVPFLILVTTALKSPDQPVYSFPPELLPLPPVFDFFVDAWTAVPYGRYVLNSVIYVATTVPAYLAISALTAYPLARYRFRGRQVIFYAILSTLFLSPEVMLIPRFLIVSSLGLVDTFAGVVLPGVLSATGIFLLRQAFAGIPQELPDSARIDGAGELRIFWNVMLPQVRPTLAVLAIFGFVSVWNNFLWPLVVLKDAGKYPVALGLAYLAGTFGADARTAAAGAVIAMVPVVAFFLAMQKHFVEGMAGAVKG